MSQDESPKVKGAYYNLKCFISKLNTYVEALPAEIMLYMKLYMRCYMSRYMSGSLHISFKKNVYVEVVPKTKSTICIAIYEMLYVALIHRS